MKGVKHAGLHMSRIRCLIWALVMCGFNKVLERTFVTVLKQRMVDTFIQEWDDSLCSKDVFQN